MLSVPFELRLLLARNPSALSAVGRLLQKQSSRYRVLTVLGFGLLHGQGFAGALSQTGLPRESFLVALLSFNLGVEFGQLSVVLVLLVALKLFVRPQHLRRYAVVPGSLAIALTGLYWGAQRLSF